MIINELWGSSSKKLKEDFSPINEQFELGDYVEITGPVQGNGLTGIVKDIGRNGSFVVVDLGKHGVRSFQASDVSVAHDDEDLDEHGGGIGPKAHWQTKMTEEPDSETVHTMAQDELEDDTDLDESERLDERAGPVSVIRWGKPWLDAGRDGSRVTSTPEYTIDYTQDNPDFQSDAHESDLETFYDYNDLDQFAGYDIESTQDTQGIQKGGDCDLVVYKTAKPTLANTLAPDPEAPNSSGASTDSEDTDDELFGSTEPEFVKDPYDLDYPTGTPTPRLSYPSVRQKQTDEQPESTQKTAQRLAEAVSRISPNTVLEHTDGDILKACYEVADRHYGMKISSVELGIMARQAIRHLMAGS